MLGRPPESLSSENLTCNVFLGELVRNTGSSLSATSPQGKKRTVRSYLPENTKEAPEHELIKGTGYFKLQIPKEISNPLNLRPSSQRLSLAFGQPRLQRSPFTYQRSCSRSPGARRHPRRSESSGGRAWLPSGLPQHTSHQDSLQFLRRSKSAMAFMEGPDLPQKSILKADAHTAQRWLFSSLHLIICFLVLKGEGRPYVILLHRCVIPSMSVCLHPQGCYSKGL